MTGGSAAPGSRSARSRGTGPRPVPTQWPRSREPQVRLPRPLSISWPRLLPSPSALDRRNEDHFVAVPEHRAVGGRLTVDGGVQLKGREPQPADRLEHRRSRRQLERHRVTTVRRPSESENVLHPHDHAADRFLSGAPPPSDSAGSLPAAPTAREPCPRAPAPRL